jgi:hypothetical protein
MNLGKYRLGIALVLLWLPGCATVVPTATSSAKVGQRVRILVTAEGMPPFKYRWEKNGVRLPNETGATIVIRDVQLSDAGVYVCVVSNSLGSADDRHKLVVEPR